MRLLAALLLTASCFMTATVLCRSETLLEQADAAYGKGRYEQAARQYLAAIRQDGLSADLLDRLADSYAAAGQTGLAVLHYERALLLAPNYAASQINLEQLRRDTGLLWEKTLLRRLSEMLGADNWLRLAGAAFVLLAAVVLSGGIMGNKRLPFIHWFNLMCVAVITLALPLALFRYQAWQDGIVTAEDAKLLISPFAEAEAVGGLKAGSLVKPGKEHGGYVLVRDENGRCGWLDRNSFQVIAAAP